MQSVRKAAGCGKNLKAIYAPSTFEMVLDALYQALGDGELSPGQRIHEFSLAEEMNVSRSILREACRHLESDGLLIRVPNKGVFVTSIGQEDIRQIFTLRSAIEVLCIREAIQRQQKETLEKCSRIVETMRKHYRLGRKKEVSDLGYRVHETICLASGSKRYIRVWNTLNIQMKMCSVFLWKHDLLPERLILHEDLLEALESNDPGLAEPIMKNHIDTAGSLLLQFMTQLSLDDGHDKP